MQEKTPSTGDGADSLLLVGIEDAHGIAISLAAFHYQFLEFIRFHNQNLLYISVCGAGPGLQVQPVNGHAVGGNGLDEILFDRAQFLVHANTPPA